MSNKYSGFMADQNRAMKALKKQRQQKIQANAKKRPMSLRNKALLAAGITGVAGATAYKALKKD